MGKIQKIVDKLRLMKKNVPEYISKNSKFEQFDFYKGE